MFRYLVTIVVVISSCYGLPEEIPNYIKICNQTDPKLGSCIRKSIISLRPYLIQGIPELDVPSLDPLYVPEIKISQNGGIQIAATFKNITIAGACKFRLRSVRADPSSDKFKMKVWFPALMMQAMYDIRGQLLMMPINGRGNCFGNFSDIDGVVSLKLNRVDKNGKDFFKVDFMMIEVRIYKTFF
jgi:Haemolymph juvenile hormone binding protein (JHBP)